MSRQVTCPQCSKGDVLRSRPRSLREHVVSWIRIVPFRCQHCSHRFLAWSVGKGDDVHSVDRREHLRIPVRLYLSFSGGKVRGEGMVMDLSLGGCIIKSDTHVRVDDIFYLEIDAVHDEAPIAVAAMVCSVSARGIAFKFLQKAQENKRLLSFIQSRSRSTSLILSTTPEPAGAVSIAQGKGSPGN